MGTPVYLPWHYLDFHLSAHNGKDRFQHKLVAEKDSGIAAIIEQTVTLTIRTTCQN